MRRRIAVLCCAGAILVAGFAGASWLSIGQAQSTSFTSCRDDTSCASGELCVLGSCRLAACTDDDGCAKGERCIAHECVVPRCSRSSDCEGGAACVDGNCRNLVVERLGLDQRDMVLVSASAFRMGSSQDTAVSDERPAHWVELASFWIDRLEVSAADFARCVDAGACVPADVQSATDQALCTYGSADAQRLPVNCVSWEGARHYCAWAGKRLPSEAEWERAAGGGQGITYPWGNQSPSCELTCRKEEEPGCGTKRVCELGSHARDESVFGALDMAGNVSEWVADWYDSDYYLNAPRVQPAGPAKAERKSVRGGDFEDVIDPLRVVSRDRLNPELRSINVGFRCARDL